ncbi:MAG TPA: hypothetical protein VGR84_12215 [Candidatus Acidoferrales bacterium]|nr:hypothetical protein [Candidatus Acidoferrales bacterium]
MFQATNEGKQAGVFRDAFGQHMQMIRHEAPSVQQKMRRCGGCLQGSDNFQAELMIAEHWTAMGGADGDEI